MLQFDEFCRLCAQKKRNKLDLFTGPNTENAKILLAKISMCLSLEVTREDMLPKMICFDCQKSVEHFNLFRIKCHKAEERLLKMLATSTPNKTTVINIKQEYLETDFHEHLNNQFELNPHAFYESLNSPNLSKTVKNVKCEVDEDADLQEYAGAGLMSSNLIQILSEEIVHQQNMEDVKQPTIEIISENFNDEFKTADVVELENNETTDIKVVPEILLRQDAHFIDEPVQNVVNGDFLPINFVEIKEAAHDSEGEEQEEEINCEILNSQRKFVSTSAPDCFFNTSEPLNRKHNKRKTALNVQCDDYEIDDKYLTLAEGETCNIDMEAVEADIKKKHDPNARFQCDQCNKSFKFFNKLRQHKTCHESQQDLFVCDYCKKANASNYEFSSLKSLKTHMQKKHLSQAADKFECCICHAVCTSKRFLKAHLKKVHSKIEVTCEICGKNFRNQARLKCHLIVHTDERPFVCDQCGKAFKWRNTLKVHMQWHNKEKNFLCSECGSKFSAKKNLIEHLNKHAGRRPFTCEHCGATFVQVQVHSSASKLSAYSKHLYHHNEGKKTHECDLCHKKFSHASMLQQHLLRHTGLRPFKCSKCSCTFKSSAELWYHTKIHEEKRHSCEVCGRKFALAKTLRDHMVVHTGIKHFCPAPGCGKTYTQRFSLTKHFVKQHPNLSIISRKGGKKPYFNVDPDPSPTDFIRYKFTEKNVKT